MKSNNKEFWILDENENYKYGLKIGQPDNENLLNDFSGTGKIKEMKVISGSRIVTEFKNNNWETLPGDEETINEDQDLITELIYEYN